MYMFLKLANSGTEKLYLYRILGRPLHPLAKTSVKIFLRAPLPGFFIPSERPPKKEHQKDPLP